MAVDVQQRQARNIAIGAILLLIVIWTIKCFPSSNTIINPYSSHAKIFPSSASTSSLQDAFLEESSNATLDTNSFPDAFGDYFDVTNSNKVAVIIEDSYRPEVVPLVIHFSSVLGPAWPIIIYTSLEDVALFSTSAALSRYITQGLIQIRKLPQTVLLLDLQAKNKFMTDKWFWETLAPAEHILLFNSDSMLCSNAATSVDEFFTYDLIGTPVDDKGHGGGLSLRKRSSMLRVLEKWNFVAEYKKVEEEEERKKKEEEERKKEEEERKKKEEERKKEEEERKKEEEKSNKPGGAKTPDGEKTPIATKNGHKRDGMGVEEKLDKQTAEDRWFQQKLQKLQMEEKAAGIRPEVDGAINLPTEDMARTFSIESLDYPHPLGLHRVHKWEGDELGKLLDWCPEYKLCTVSHHGKEFPTFENGGSGW